MKLTQSNPFSSRFIRAGTIPFVFSNNLDAGEIYYRFEATQFCAQILGPHGSGKSTLAREIEPLLQTRFDRVEFVTIRRDGNRIVVDNRARKPDPPETGSRRLLVVDGAERISRRHRWLLKTTCRQQHIGLLATVHRPTSWLPTIAALQPDLSTFLQTCDQLQHANECRLERRCLERAFRAANGNFREAFMALYDVHQRNSQMIS